MSAPWWRWQRPVFGLLALLWSALIWTASAQPGDALAPHAPGPTGNLAHIAVHGALALLLLRALAAPRAWSSAEAWPGARTPVGRAVLGLTALSALADETHQFFVAGRTCSVADLFLDLAGALVVLLLPWPRGEGRPNTWAPAVLVALAAAALAVAGWAVELPGDGLLHALLALGFTAPA